jgi:phage repressor protein C with HTH and peptisase S24 domain
MRSLSEDIKFPYEGFGSTLNTMFNSNVNRACNTSCLVAPIIPRMHKQMERLYLAAKELRGVSTQAELARALNQSSQTVKNWESRGISMAGMLKAQGEIGCSATWLETGDGPMSIGPVPSVGEPADAQESPFIESAALFPGAKRVVVGDEPDTVPVPRVRLRLRAGTAQFDTEPDMEGDGQEQIPRAVLTALRIDPRNLLAVRVRGMSMEPMLFEDDVIVIDKSDTKPVSREIYAVNFNGEACIKQLVYRGGQWYLHSINPDHGPVNTRSGQCSIVGRVVYQPGRVVTGRL